jgi:hypothetical protein
MAAVVAASLLLTACDLPNAPGWILPDSGYGTNEAAVPRAIRPIYLPYAELRKPISVEPDHPLKNFGKIYVYGPYLFINSRNQGIYIFDNTDPTQPVYRSFLKIPGNVDIAVKDGILYADSYVDLVAVDLRDATQIHELARFTDVFPYDGYQNVPEGVYFDSIDSSRGVVVGYE